ncbi:hypothetical protein MKW94_030381, partial [Papaver nudicaule]|nr:hypothetical protein [Papaver nudicaule]
NQLHETTRWSVGVEVQSVFKPVFKENDLIPAAKSILLHTPEENVTVYERFSDEDGDYTHRLGSITLPKTCDG